MLGKYLARLLTLLAMLVAPFGMLSGHAAMAAPATQPAGGHCADMGASHDQAPDDTAPAANIDCMMACACVPAEGAELANVPSLAKEPAISANASDVVGANPAADPPPPRPA
jgi:hypothetical protein